MSSKKPLRLALVGLGHLGKFHAQKISSLEATHLQAIVEPSKSGQELASKDFPEASLVSRIDQLDPKAIEALVVTAPTGAHFYYLNWCWEHEIACFCEKPVCASYEEALEFEKKLKQKSIPIQVGHSERLQPIWQLLLEKLEKQRPFSIEIYRYAPFKGRALDVGVAEDLGVHDFDTLYYLTGEVPSSARGQTRSLLSRADDYARIHLDYASELQVSIVLSRVSVEEKREYVVYFEDETWHIDLLKRRFRIARFPKEEFHLDDWKEYQGKDFLLEEHKQFASYLVGETPCAVSFEDALQAMKVLQLVKESC